MEATEQEAVAREFGQNMRRARRRAGLSQADLGKQAGLHRTAISMLERVAPEAVYGDESPLVEPTTSKEFG